MEHLDRPSVVLIGIRMWMVNVRADYVWDQTMLEIVIGKGLSQRRMHMAAGA